MMNVAFLKRGSGCAENLTRIFIFILIVFLCQSLPLRAQAKAVSVPFDTERNKRIAALISDELVSRQVAHEQLNDALSRKIFELYLQQLDPRKRYLLQQDVDVLNGYQTKIDDELKTQNIHLPDVGRNLLVVRVKEVEQFIDPLFQKGFDFNKPENIETDPKKISFAKDLNELRERWHLTLKMQVLDSYFETLEEKKKKDPETYKNIDPKAHPKEMAEALEKVKRTTHRAMQRLQQQDRQDDYDRFFDAVARAFDPHSNYMPPVTKEDFDIQMSGSLEGIGALLREDEGMIKVVRILPGSAAEKQGQLQAEDIILSATEKDGAPVDVSEMRLREAVSYIRGPKGTEVRLTVLKPGGGRLTIPIVRDVVHIEETYVKSTLLRTKNGSSIGYLRIPSFYRDFNTEAGSEERRNSSDDTLKLLQELKKSNIQGVILDLRSNGGGALEDAVRISGLFLPGGPVVQVKDVAGEVTPYEDEEPQVAFDGPMIVLVNQFSASASEIVAAALQDYDRALIIGGEHTHGKGTVQAMINLNRQIFLFPARQKVNEDLGALKLTIQKFYRVTGGSTQFKGVIPDLIVPSLLDHLKSGEKYLDFALPWDQIQAVPFTPWQGEKLKQEQLLKNESQWVTQNESFQKIKEEDNRAVLRLERTMATISVGNMWQERQSLEKTREEAKAAGLIDESENDEADAGTPVNSDEKLQKALANDPYVQLAVKVFSDAEK